MKRTAGGIFVPKGNEWSRLPVVVPTSSTSADVRTASMLWSTFEQPRSSADLFVSRKVDPKRLAQIVGNTCGSGSTMIASINDSFSEYGIYGIDAGPANGQCSFTVQDFTNDAKGTEYITNGSNS